MTAFAFLGERSTACTAVGFGLVLAGVALVKRDALREKFVRRWTAGSTGR